jgi:hypothetical protein
MGELEGINIVGIGIEDGAVESGAGAYRDYDRKEQR